MSPRGKRGTGPFARKTLLSEPVTMVKETNGTAPVAQVITPNGWELQTIAALREVYKLAAGRPVHIITTAPLSVADVVIETTPAEMLNTGQRIYTNASGNTLHEALSNVITAIRAAK